MTQGNTDSARLLIVEDHPQLRAALQLFFEIRGYEVAAADSYETAIEAAEQNAPDIAICDWDIGGSRSGADVARKLQKLFRSKIVFVTGASVEELCRRTQDISVIQYFKKPVAPDKIAAAIGACA